MKRIISIALVCMLLGAMLSPIARADGLILFQDDFSSGELNELDWVVNGTEFTVEDSGPTNGYHLEGWRPAVVQQTSYGEDAPAPRVYGTGTSFKVDAWAYDDGGNDDDQHSLGLWWADYFYDVEDPHNRIIYTLRVFFEDRAVRLFAEGVGEGEAFIPSEEFMVGEWLMPDSVELNMDTANPTVFSMGMSINGNVIEGYFNDLKVVKYTAPRMGEAKSPLLLLNGRCWCGFDNFIVTTADYNLFNQTGEPQPADTAPQIVVTFPEDSAAVSTNEHGEAVTTNAGTTAPVTQIVKEVVEKVVHSTDAEGNDITEIETEIVEKTVTQAPQANTNTNAPTATTGGSQTGDMTIVVGTVMVIALGTALVVRKVTLK